MGGKLMFSRLKYERRELHTSGIPLHNTTSTHIASEFISVMNVKEAYLREKSFFPDAFLCSQRTG